jgi:hypothetical protein
VKAPGLGCIIVVVVDELGILIEDYSTILGKAYSKILSHHTIPVLYLGAEGEGEQQQEQHGRHIQQSIKLINQRWSLSYNRANY